MHDLRDSKSTFIIIAAVVAVLIVFSAVTYILLQDTKEDPTVTASYKNLNKKERVLELPMPEDISADFRLDNGGRWVANGPVTDNELKKLAQSEPSIQSLHIVGGEISPEGFKLLKDKNVRGIRLEYMELTPAHADALSTLPDLESVDLRDKSIDDDFIDHLKCDPRKLTSIHMWQAKVTNQGLETIVSRYPDLTDFANGNDRNFNDGGLAIVARLKKLTILEVNSSPVTKEAVLAFVKSHPKINQLHIADLNVDDDYVAKLPKYLISLDLSYNPITDRSIATISQMKKLKTFRLNGKTMVTIEGINKLKKALPTTYVLATKSNEAI